MKKFFNDLFNDKNKINEKSFIGFLAFVTMVVFAIMDIVTGALGKDLLVNDFIFNSFLYLTLGCFGIASIDKYINKKDDGEQAS
jgi:DMSO/TMAO reductase YedYZ heme-binding membrane subunit